MKFTFTKLATVAAIGSLAASIPASAGLVFSYEAAGVQSTTVPGVTTETFDNLGVNAPSGGTLNYSGSVFGGLGSLSTGGALVSATKNGGAYGGANATDYYSVGTQSGANTATLSFVKPQDYFGMWWAAGDANNVLEIYNGATLLGSYNPGNILASLPSTYLGNPNNGLDKGEKFVYIDFTTTGTDGITSIKFSNTKTTGFEMDNLSILDTPIVPPGTVVPDTGSTLLMLGGAMAVIVSARRNRK